MPTGVVKWFNDDKGYGFIKREGGSPDVFVHIRQVEQSGLNGLVEGQQVTFEVQQDRRSGKDSAAELKLAG